MTKVQKIDLLHAFYVSSIIIAELMGSKLFTIGGVINASVAVFVLPLTFSMNDIVFEVYGRKRALSFVKSGFYMLFFLALFNVLALVLPPAERFLPTAEAYNTIFSKSLRIIVASLTAFYVSERLDVYVFSRIKEKMKDTQLWLRNNLSNFFGQLIDTIIFMFLAFYSPGNFWFILSLIWPYWLLKFGFTAFGTPLTYAGVKWLKTGDKE